MTDNKQNSETGNVDSARDDKATPGSGAFSTKSAKDIDSPTGKTETTSMVTDKVSMPSGGAVNVPKDNMNKATDNKTTGDKATDDKAADSVGAVTTEAIGQVKDKASSLLGEQKTNLASGVASVADSIRQV